MMGSRVALLSAKADAAMSLAGLSLPFFVDASSNSKPLLEVSLLIPFMSFNLVEHNSST